MAEHNFKDQYEYWDQEADKLLGVANGMNYQDFQNGSEYQDLNTRYTDRGNKAMENTLAQVAARTGGLASSYATMAANNSYNDYMSQLEDAARNLYSQRLNESQQAYQLARNNADDYYSRWMQEQQLAAAKSSGGGRYYTPSTTPETEDYSYFELVEEARNLRATHGGEAAQKFINQLNVPDSTKIKLLSTLSNFETKGNDNLTKNYIESNNKTYYDTRPNNTAVDLIAQEYMKDRLASLSPKK